MSPHAYRSEYAKSGKASCKGCKQLIENKSLRLAIMVQVNMSDFRFKLSHLWFPYSLLFSTECNLIGFIPPASLHAVDPKARTKLKIFKIYVGMIKKISAKGLVIIWIACGLIFKVYFQNQPRLVGAAMQQIQLQRLKVKAKERNALFLQIHLFLLISAITLLNTRNRVGLNVKFVKKRLRRAKFE